MAGTRRTPIRRPQALRITPELLDTYALVNQFYNDKSRQRDFYDAELKLDRMLGRAPWQATLSDTFDLDEPPDWLVRQHDDFHVADWREALALRIQLDQALSTRESS